MASGLWPQSAGVMAVWTDESFAQNRAERGLGGESTEHHRGRGLTALFSAGLSPRCREQHEQTCSSPGRPVWWAPPVSWSLERNRLQRITRLAHFQARPSTAESGCLAPRRQYRTDRSAGSRPSLGRSGGGRGHGAACVHGIHTRNAYLWDSAPAGAVVGLCMRQGLGSCSSARRAWPVPLALRLLAPGEEARSSVGAVTTAVPRPCPQALQAPGWGACGVWVPSCPLREAWRTW